MVKTGIQLRSSKVFRTALAAALLCLLVYLRAIFCDFINLDDPVYVLNNTAIRHLDLNLLTTVFSQPYYFGWLPLTYLSFAVDYHFWGLNPLGYHLTNVLFHAVNVFLVVMIADKFMRVEVVGLRGAEEESSNISLLTQLPTAKLYPVILLLIGLLWGVHPLRVESVVWVSQRKDVLNGLLTLGSLFFYLRYVQSKVLAEQRRSTLKNYGLSLGLFAFSLLAKQVSVVLPVVLLLIDWYPLGRVRKERLIPLLLEKLPYLFLSVAVSGLTIYFAAQSNVMISAAEFPYYARTLVSGNAIFEYCRFFVWPVGIQPYFVIGDELPLAFTLKTVTVVVFTFATCSLARKKPFLAATWFCFLLPLLPVLAFTQTADDTAFASRYTYLPAVAPSVAFGALLVSLTEFAEASRTRFTSKLMLSLVSLVVIVYGAITLQLVAAWQNAGTLWTRQIEIQPLGRAYTFRGIYYFTAKNYPTALNDFASSIKIAEQTSREDVFNLYAHHGEALRALGRHDEALVDFTTAINLSGQPQYYYFRGCSLQSLGRVSEAEEDFKRAGEHTGPIKWFPAKFSHGVFQGGQR